MHTTETERLKAHIPAFFPTLQLLYTPASGIVGQAFCLREGSLSIGRDLSEAEGIGLEGDRRASRLHASIGVKIVDAQAQVVLRDEQSKNGTFVNGKNISQASLCDGDVVRMGNSLLLLRIAPAQLRDAELPLLLGRAPAICGLRHRLSEVAPSSVPVLLLGEPGVGKELAARSVHERSQRRGPFLARNCAGLNESLADSLLFGHARGAFTGATERHAGIFAAAHGGTLFLDEIAELPLPVQAKLLRALQEGEVLPVGREQAIHVDVRVIAATNRALDQAVQDGVFRDDLYSRLRGAVVTLPPLRARREDVLPLLAHFFGSMPQLTPRLAEALLLYTWPHNVRELVFLAQELRRKATVEKELDLPVIEDQLFPTTSSQASHPGDPVASLPGVAGSRSTPNAAPEGPNLTRETLARLGEETQWNISRIAEFTGRSRRQVSRVLDKFGFPRPFRVVREKSGIACDDGDRKL